MKGKTLFLFWSWHCSTSTSSVIRFWWGADSPLWQYPGWCQASLTVSTLTGSSDGPARLLLRWMSGNARAAFSSEYQSRLIGRGRRQVLRSQIQAQTDPLWASAHWGEVNNSLLLVKLDRWSIWHSQRTRDNSERGNLAHVWCWNRKVMISSVYIRDGPGMSRQTSRFLHRCPNGFS